MPVALITGASSGIGRALAFVFAEHGYDLVLVARTQASLNEVKGTCESKHKVSVSLIVADLSEREAANAVFTTVKNSGTPIDVLVNNAGIGDYGWFHESALERQQHMIDVNITSLMQLTRLFVTDMVSRGKGRILNIASTAAFQPGPTMAVYFATKSFVLHFSEAIANELKGTGVTVTVVCPGATQSRFEDTARMNGKGLFSKKGHPTSEAVARFSYDALMKGKVVAIHGALNRFLTWTVRFSPRAAVVAITRRIQQMGQ